MPERLKGVFTTRRCIEIHVYLYLTLPLIYIVHDVYLPEYRCAV